MPPRKLAIFFIATLAIILASYIAARPKSIDLTSLQPDQIAELPDPSAALAVFEAKLAENPADAASLTIMGNLYLRLGRETGNADFNLQAREVLERAISLVPNYTQAQLSLTSAYSTQHLFFDALALAQEIQARD